MGHTVDSISMYLKVFGALLLLTGLTVGAAYIDFGVLSVPIALGIAGFKAVLVIWFFMHVRHGDPLTKLFVVAGFFWLLLAAIFTFADYFTRDYPVFDQDSWIYSDATHFHNKPAPAGLHHGQESSTAHH